MWMTHKQAMEYAIREARATGIRQRVYKSRAVVGWWHVNPTWMPTQLRGRAASTPRP